MGNPFLSYWARLYSKPTAAELALEPAVAALGIPYRAQHPLFGRGVILDFAVFPFGLGNPGWAWEVDGSSHDSPKAQEKDRVRTQKLVDAGWVVARCKNADAIARPAHTVGLLKKECEHG